jgi:hypothetical protein
MSSEPKSHPSEAPPSPNSSQVASLPATPSQPKKRFLDHFPPWVATNIRSKQSRKMLFRCWLGSWAAFVLILPEKTLMTMGNAYVSSSFRGDCWTVLMVLLVTVVLFLPPFDASLSLSMGRILVFPQSVIGLATVPSRSYSSSFVQIISNDWIEC